MCAVLLLPDTTPPMPDPVMEFLVVNLSGAPPPTAVQTPPTAHIPPTHPANVTLFAA